ncbi:MAG: hypothetical protein GX851_02420, partial [Clostridiales bacterium]|nr:hypothetical protein [Clostridiales bacterium]
SGRNYSGYLGLGDSSDRNVLTDVMAFSDIEVARIFAYDSSSVVFCSDGTIYAAGNLGYTRPQNTFTEITAFSGKKVIQFEVGAIYAMALCSDGTVYAAGYNNHGQLGLGDNTDRTAFTEVTSLKGKNVTQISAGYAHTLALCSDGKLYASGQNNHGQLGLGDNTDRTAFTEVTSLADKGVTQIYAANSYSIALCRGGTTYASGRNNYGQLGLGDSIDKNSFTEITSLSNKGVTEIAASDFHAIALCRDGTIYASGRNFYGNFGRSGTNFENSFVEIFPPRENMDILEFAAGDRFTLLLCSDGKLYASGLNNLGQLGLGDNTNRRSFTEVSLLLGKTAVQIAADLSHSTVLRGDGTVYAAGNNSDGRLGVGDKTDRTDFTKATGLGGKPVKQIASGKTYTLAICADDTVYAAGNNIYGQLGLGDNTDRTDFTQVTSLAGKSVTQIAAGGSFAMALCSDGTVYAAGYNLLYQLGLGDNESRNTFTQVTALAGKDVTQIAAGDNHALALCSDGTVYASGSNSYGQYGLGNNSFSTAFTEVTALKDKAVTQIYAGFLNSVALCRDGRVYATGYNYYGQLGLGDCNDKNSFTEVTSLANKGVTQIALGNSHSLALCRDGTVYSAGYNNCGQLGVGDTADRTAFTEATAFADKSVTQIAAGNDYTMALCSDGAICALGKNEYGQLGLGDTADKMQITAVPGFMRLHAESLEEFFFVYSVTIKVSYTFLYDDIEPLSGTGIDYQQLSLITHTQQVRDMGTLVSVKQGSDMRCIASHGSGMNAHYGTGSGIVIFKDNVRKYDFTLVVMGDLNGDSVCDGIDLAHAELVMNMHGMLSGVYKAAADFDTDGKIDINDFSAIENKSL